MYIEIRTYLIERNCFSLYNKICPLPFFKKYISLPYLLYNSPKKEFVITVKRSNNMLFISVFSSNNETKIITKSTTHDCIVSGVSWPLRESLLPAKRILERVLMNLLLFVVSGRSPLLIAERTSRIEMSTVEYLYNKIYFFVEVV